MVTEQTNKKTPNVNTSGWTAEELSMLDCIAKADGMDRSKAIRALVRKEHAKRNKREKVTA
jgi:hypothetical protein